jgi:NAD(P)-dependent dehydrogenase (short-subunit alcohol dehydrogenase family)
MSARPLDGRTALVTGGSRGIGRAICLALAEAGAAVAFTFREREDQAANVCSELEALGAKPLSIKMEVSDRASVEAARNRLATRWPALNVLVNNAGINKPTDFDQITDADWDQILAVNLTGPFIVTQTFWPMLTAAHGASVIHIGSVSGTVWGPTNGPLCGVESRADFAGPSDRPLWREAQNPIQHAGRRINL